jgi:hypothetical protein
MRRVLLVHSKVFSPPRLKTKRLRDLTHPIPLSALNILYVNKILSKFIIIWVSRAVLCNQAHPAILSPSLQEYDGKEYFPDIRTLFHQREQWSEGC